MSGDLLGAIEPEGESEKVPEALIGPHERKEDEDESSVPPVCYRPGAGLG